MKKIQIPIILFILLFTLSGCGAKSAAPNTNTTNTTNKISKSSTGAAVKYKDGVYDVKHKSQKPGYEEAVITIKSNKLEGIELRRLDANQKEVDYNKWTGANGWPNLKQDRLDLAKAMMSKQSPNVDVISGATQSSNGWKAAVSSALAKAQ